MTPMALHYPTKLAVGLLCSFRNNSFITSRQALAIDSMRAFFNSRTSARQYNFYHFHDLSSDAVICIAALEGQNST
jgi:hypothetical protein